jgi:Domain of unknown function (DUF4326)
VTVSPPQIQVVHVRDVRPGRPAVYVGRENPRAGLPGSPLANPFRMRSEADRPAVIAAYTRWLDTHLRVGAAPWPVTGELVRLAGLARLAAAARRPLRLACWCAPRPCHADPIRDVLLRMCALDVDWDAGLTQAGWRHPPDLVRHLGSPLSPSWAGLVGDVAGHVRPAHGQRPYHVADATLTTGCGTGAALVHNTLMAAVVVPPDRRCGHPGCQRLWPPYTPVEEDTGDDRLVVAVADLLADVLTLVGQVVEQRFPDAVVEARLQRLLAEHGGTGHDREVRP